MGHACDWKLEKIFQVYNFLTRRFRTKRRRRCCGNVAMDRDDLIEATRGIMQAAGRAFSTFPASRERRNLAIFACYIGASAPLSVVGADASNRFRFAQSDVGGGHHARRQQLLTLNQSPCRKRGHSPTCLGLSVRSIDAVAIGMRRLRSIPFDAGLLSAGAILCGTGPVLLLSAAVLRDLFRFWLLIPGLRPPRAGAARMARSRSQRLRPPWSSLMLKLG